jgi:hypothetical protein
MITLSRFCTIVTPVKVDAEVKLNPGPDGRPPGGVVTGGGGATGAGGVPDEEPEEAVAPPSDLVDAAYPHPVATITYEARNSHRTLRASIRPVDVMAHSYFDLDGDTHPTPEMVREAGTGVECREMSTARSPERTSVTFSAS